MHISNSSTHISGLQMLPTRVLNRINYFTMNILNILSLYKHLQWSNIPYYCNPNVYLISDSGVERGSLNISSLLKKEYLFKLIDFKNTHYIY